MRANSFAILFGPLGNAEQQDPRSPLICPSLFKTMANMAYSKGTSPRPIRISRHSPAARLSSSSRDRIAMSRLTLCRTVSVPTWNYIAVHAYGTLELVEHETEKYALLDRLIRANDPAYADQWSSLPDGYRNTLLSGIVGFRIPIARIEGKFKLSQNRPEVDRRSVHAAQVAGNSDQRALASWMERLAGW